MDGAGFVDSRPPQHTLGGAHRSIVGTGLRADTVPAMTSSTALGRHGPIRAVLFDMGGVVVELGPLDGLLGTAMEAADSWPRWLASPSVRSFERGQCTVDEFAVGLCAELGLALTPTEVVQRFRHFPRGLFPGAAEMVEEVRQGATTAVLSNTNALHWETQIDAERVAGLFDRRFLSYELGLVKPDAAIFERALTDLDVPADQVLFLDDNQVNVEAARLVGLRAHRTRGVEEACLVLRRYGLLVA